MPITTKSEGFTFRDMKNETVTIFKSLFNTDTPFHITLDDCISRIKNGKSRAIIESIRKEGDKELKSKLKAKLPAILFSGAFSERNKSGMIYHSGMMVIDFDDFENQKVYHKMWENITNNKHVVFCFRSPSGNGIKAVVRIPKTDAINHERYFKEFQRVYEFDYFDKSNCDVSRVCFESYDPKCYVNKKAEIFSPILEDKGFSISEKVVYTPITDEDKIISKIMDWNWKYNFQEGERNSFAYALSRKFCEYGVSQSGSESFIINHFSEKDFSDNEIKNTVKSAYRSTQFGIYKFEDYNKKKELEEDIKYKPKEEVIKKYNIDPNDYNQIKDDITVDEFWIIEEKKNGKKIKIDNYKFKIFLEKRGFKKTYLNETGSPIFVKITSNIVEETSTEKIKDYVLNYLLEKKNNDIWSYFASYSYVFSTSYLTMLETIDLMMLSDQRDKSFIAFNNGILEVTKDKTNLIDYIDIDGYVWKSHIVGRDFKKTKKDDNDYKKFIDNISNNNSNTMKSVIGSLLSTYKNKANNTSIIFNDETISDDPEGGTGKGLILQGISQIRNVSILDGKTFDFNNSFPYQTISKDTAVLVFDDVKRNFNFESMFSIITEGITLERKGKDAVKLPIEQSPKIAITTNYVIPGSGNSNDRRRFEVEVKQHYTKGFTPFDDFGKLLFDDWSDEEFLAFDNYMVNCLQLFLKEGLIEQEDAKNIEIRKFIASTNKEFYEWVKDGNIPINERFYRSDKYSQFVNDYPDYGSGRFKLSQKSFKIYVDRYASFIGLEIKEGRDNIGRFTEIIDETKDMKIKNEVPF